MTLVAHVSAALAEIVGCFAFWADFRLRQPVWCLLPGVASLIAFVWCLTLVDADAEGRTYAACGVIFIAASLSWLWLVENHQPDRWDFTGAAVCLAGAAIRLLGPGAEGQNGDHSGPLPGLATPLRSGEDEPLLAA